MTDFHKIKVCLFCVSVSLAMGQLSAAWLRDGYKGKDGMGNAE